MPFRRAGFTLIELSIVIVIIGLVIGGVMVGKDLINAAKLRAAASSLIRFDTVFNAFRLKYNCFAGDCPNTTDFFGDYAADTNCAVMTNGSGNGNGNGYLDDGGSGHWYCEAYSATYSLQIAGFIPSDSAYGEFLFKGPNDSLAFFYHDDISSRVPVKYKKHNFLGRAGFRNFRWWGIQPGGWANS